MTKIQYVTMVVIDPALGLAIGLTKLKGPKHLIGRITFPGGKIEPGEAAVTAASRELLEETGVEVPAANWQQVRFVEGADYELTVLTALSNKVSHARSIEAEPVWRLDIPWHLDNAKRQPSQYASDFSCLLHSAWAAHNLIPNRLSADRVPQD